MPSPVKYMFEQNQKSRRSAEYHSPKLKHVSYPVDFQNGGHLEDPELEFEIDSLLNQQSVTRDHEEYVGATGKSPFHTSRLTPRGTPSDKLRASKSPLSSTTTRSREPRSYADAPEPFAGTVPSPLFSQLVHALRTFSPYSNQQPFMRTDGDGLPSDPRNGVEINHPAVSPIRFPTSPRHFTTPGGPGGSGMPPASFETSQRPQTASSGELDDSFGSNSHIYSVFQEFLETSQNSLSEDDPKLSPWSKNGVSVASSVSVQQPFSSQPAFPSIFSPLSKPFQASHSSPTPPHHTAHPARMTPGPNMGVPPPERVLPGVVALHNFSLFPSPPPQSRSQPQQQEQQQQPQPHQPQPHPAPETWAMGPSDPNGGGMAMPPPPVHHHYPYQGYAAQPMGMSAPQPPPPPPQGSMMPVPVMMTYPAPYPHHQHHYLPPPPPPMYPMQPQQQQQSQQHPTYPPPQPSMQKPGTFSDGVFYPSSAGMMSMNMNGAPGAGQGASATTPDAAWSGVGGIGVGNFDSFYDDRPETAESPSSKMLIKDFSKKFKEKEKEGFDAALAFAVEALKNVEEKLQWRVCMEVADLAKRENRERDARYWFRRVNQLQPYAAQGWLEYAKMEEECGKLERCQKILALGLAYCPFNESLLVKGIKHEEAMVNVPASRALLSRLKFISLDKSWKTILEGALLEARCGNFPVARKIFKYLMKNVPRHGPIYYEAYRLEERCEEFDRGLEIVERGLAANPRYGPLWFGAFRLYERIGAGDLTRIREAVDRAVKSISKELVWKVYFECAQVEERAGNLENARIAYAKSVLHSLPNLRWKVWLGGARTELNANNVELARQLLDRALTEVPRKTRAVVLLECARLEEYAGNIEKARDILKRAQRETRHEWKVFLESILLEMRTNNIVGAINEAENALEMHRGTGRLWAVLIQLMQHAGEDMQLKIFRKALKEVPKSGEVWCEGARIHLNPLSSKFDLYKARQYLDFAIRFTPQYGDSFIEYLRLELLTNGPEADNSALEQSCVNADPNYGPMWFHCKANPFDSTRQVLRNAKQMLIAETAQDHQIYQRAIMRSQCMRSRAPEFSIVGGRRWRVPVGVAPYEVGRYGHVPPDVPYCGEHCARLRSELPECDCPTMEDFVTGLPSLNRMYRSMDFLGRDFKRKIIFSDQITP